MVIRKFITSFVLLLACILMQAQTVTVQAPRQVIEGTLFQVVFQLDDARADDIKVGKIDGCTELNGPGVTTSSSITIINGKRTESSTTGYAYTYRAVKAGTYTIPAATLVINGKQVQSKPTQITVLPPDTNQSSSGNQSQYGNSGRPTSPTGQTPDASQTISSNDIFVKILFNKNHVYEGEAVECTLKLYTRYNSISGIQPLKLPTFDGFLIEEINQTAQNNDIEHINGQNYLTAVLKIHSISSKVGQTHSNFGRVQRCGYHYATCVSRLLGNNQCSGRTGGQTVTNDSDSEHHATTRS